MIISDITNLSKWSNVEIDLLCDSCNSPKNMKYKLYTSYGYSNGDYLCRKCKLKKNNLEKYGVENVFQLDSTKEKTKKTNKEKYGVEFISQSIDINIKVKDSLSKLDKESIKEKKTNTNLEKYGVDNISKCDDVKKKKVDRFLSNWKTENNRQNEDFRKLYFKIAKNKNYLNYLEKGNSSFSCDQGKEHSFEINIENYSKRIKYQTILCTICNPIDRHQSGQEIMLFNFIKSIYNGEIKQSYRNKYEIDIYLPELNLGFEFNGIYWHSEKYKEKDAHLIKTKFFNEKGIHIFHIWEDDWNYKSDIIKSQIKNILKLSNRIYARNCDVRLISDINVVRNFLNNNHIQGYVNSNIKIGLYLNDELVSMMIFDHLEGRNRMSDDEWNLSRFCNKIGYTVVGGASKLLKYFINNNKVVRIISYADRDWSNGNLYEKLGFIKIKESNPDYKYVIDGKRIHKSNFKKNEKTLTIPKIWDCGKIKYEKV